MLHASPRAIAMLLSVHNDADIAYIFGGCLHENAQEYDCTDVSSVEALNMSVGVWQAFDVPLDRSDDFFQIATLDDDIGASLRTNDNVDKHSSAECIDRNTTTALPSTTSSLATMQDGQPASMELGLILLVKLFVRFSLQSSLIPRARSVANELLRKKLAK